MSQKDIFESAYQMALRKRNGFQACCAFIDLLGMTDLILNDIEEAQNRLDRLHEGIVNGLDIYPGLTDCNASFFGDSVVITKELNPEEKMEDVYPKFCGHIYCLNTLIFEIEQNLGNAGIRTFVSHGKLIPLTRPSAWQEQHFAHTTKEWRVLTGANEAFAKCCKADEIGSDGGFNHNMFWSENLKNPLEFQGIPFFELSPETYRNDLIYEQIYNQFIKTKFTETAILDLQEWKS